MLTVGSDKMIIVIDAGACGGNPNKMVNVYGQPNEADRDVRKVMDKIAYRKVQV